MEEEAEAAPSTSENTNFSGLKIILPTYDGSTDPKSWLRQLDKIRKAKNWSEAQLILQAPLLLKDRADDYWETIEDDVTTWKDFKEKFTAEFGERKTVCEHLADLTTMSRKVDEPLDVLLGRINTKYGKAFPTADLTKDEHKQQITERFVKALIFGSNSVDAKLGQHLQVHKTDLANPRLMLKAANDLLPLFVATLSTKPIWTVNAEPSLSEQELDSLEDRIVNRLTAVLHLPHSPSSQESTKPCDEDKNWHQERHDNKMPIHNKKNSSCYTCQSPQHFARSCPYRNACRRCWKEGHRTRECPEPKPCPCPLNLKGLGEKHHQ